MVGSVEQRALCGSIAAMMVAGPSAGLCDVETAAGRLRAAVRAPIAPGTSVVVAVRPERMVLRPDGEGLSGTIVEVIFLGTARKYVVRLADETECVALRQVSDPPLDPKNSSVRASSGVAHATAFEA